MLVCAHAYRQRIDMCTDMGNQGPTPGWVGEAFAEAQERVMCPAPIEQEDAMPDSAHSVGLHRTRRPRSLDLSTSASELPTSASARQSRLVCKRVPGTLEAHVDAGAFGVTTLLSLLGDASFVIYSGALVFWLRLCWDLAV